MTAGNRGRPAGPKKLALNLRLDPDIHKRIKIHALMTDATASDVIADLVTKHLTAYLIQANQGGNRL